MPPIKIFISHKQEDAAVATKIGSYITARGLDVYLDTIDSHLSASGPDLADYIRRKLEECTQLLAVISHRTKTSWWVPWEIGVATEKERFLASYVSDSALIPEYLQMWPYLRSNADLDAYIQESKNASLLVEQTRRSGHQATARTTGFRSFHSNLKSVLRQS